MKVDLTDEQRRAHRITWWVTGDGRNWLRHTAGMRGTWGWDAKCSCGWESRSGGGVRSFVRRMVENHKLDVKLGFA